VPSASPSKAEGCNPEWLKAIEPGGHSPYAEANTSSPRSAVVAFSACERLAGWQPARQQTGQSAPRSKRSSLVPMHAKNESGLSRIHPHFGPQPERWLNSQPIPANSSCCFTIVGIWHPFGEREICSPDTGGIVTALLNPRLISGSPPGCIAHDRPDPPTNHQFLQRCEVAKRCVLRSACRISKPARRAGIH